MYTTFYGFSEKPFNITPDPRFLFLTESHEEALAALFYGIKEKKGFICLTGEVGTGKTTVIYRLLDSLSNRVVSAFIYHTSATFDQLLKNILLELRIPVDGEERYLLLDRLNAYLLETLARDEIVVLFVDEAQNLPVEALEALRMLSNLETRREKLLQIVLVGQPELDIKLDSAELRQLRQRIVVRRQIRPLNQEECRAYIDHRLHIVHGSASEVFAPEAVSLICDYCQGIPRLINVICDNALFVAYGAGKKRIGPDIIKEVISDINGPAQRAVSFFAAPEVQTTGSRGNVNTRKIAVLKQMLSTISRARAERPNREMGVSWARH